MGALLKSGHRGRAIGNDLSAIPSMLQSVLLAQQFGVDWYVNSAASSGGDGKTPDSAMTTLAAALGAAAANDRIFVAPGHAETVTSSNFTLNKASVTIFCLGRGTAAPAFTFSTAAATINVTAANVTWVGGRFAANFLDVASAFTIAAVNFRCEGGYFHGGASLNFLSCFTTGATDNTADGLEIVGCTWYNLDTSPLAFISILQAMINLYVADCHVDSASTADVGHFITFAAKVVLNARILRNTLNVVGSTAQTVGIFATGSSTTSTGIMAYNLVYSLDTTTELIVTATLDFAMFENYYSGNLQASGKLWPAVDLA